MDLEKMLRSLATTENLHGDAPDAAQEYVEICKSFIADPREQQRISDIADLLDAEDELYVQARVALESGDDDSAEVLLRRAADAGLGEATSLLAGLLERQGKMAEAAAFHLRASNEGILQAGLVEMIETRVELRTTARLVTAGSSDFIVIVFMSYDSADPFAVRFSFRATRRHGSTTVDWLFARDLLQTGLSEHAGQGDVQVGPEIESDHSIMISLSSSSGNAIFRFDRHDITDFLERSYRQVPAGLEELDLCSDISRFETVGQDRRRRRRRHWNEL
jgi:hypothetical protein